MAGIDKIYGTNAQYDEFYAWAKENMPGYLGCFYPRDGYEEEHRPITNFPSNVDRWLLHTCPLRWVTDRIKEQYGMERSRQSQ
jgi:hypothetical protein